MASLGIRLSREKELVIMSDFNVMVSLLIVFEIMLGCLIMSAMC